MASRVQHTIKKNVTPVLNVPPSLNKWALVIYKKKRMGWIRFTIVMGNQDLYVIWKILKILRIFMNTLYLIFLPHDAGKIFSGYEGNESVAKGGDKSNH